MSKIVSQSVEQTSPPATELPPDIQAQLLLLGLQINNSGYVVWRKDNPAHPRNWTGTRKAFDIGLIILFDLFAFVILSNHQDAQGQLMYVFRRLIISTAGVSQNEFPSFYSSL